jgi:hypothetical protein
MNCGQCNSRALFVKYRRTTDVYPYEMITFLSYGVGIVRVRQTSSPCPPSPISEKGGSLVLSLSVCGEGGGG